MGTELEKLIEKLEDLAVVVAKFEGVSEKAIEPSAQLSLLAENLSKLSLAVGSIFLPVVQEVLPYVNGFIIALRRMISWLSELAGIENADILAAINDMDLSAVIGGAKDAESELKNVVTSVKNLKGALHTLDELNVITSHVTSNKSIAISTGAFANISEELLTLYQQNWHKVLWGRVSEANDFAGKVEEYLQPIKTIISNLLKGDFFSVGYDVSELVENISNFFANVIENVDWNTIGGSIGEFLVGVDWNTILNSVGYVIWKGIKSALVLWGAAFEAAPIETSILSAIGLLKWSGLTASLFAPLEQPLIGALSPVVSSAFTKVLQGLTIANLSWNVGAEILEDVTGKEGFADVVQEHGIVNTFEDICDVLNGLPARLGIESQASYAFGDALEAIAQGTIYTDEQLKKMQEKWNFSEEDIESLRQTMLMYNEELKLIADGFGLFDTSAETLQDVQYGIQCIVEGTISASEAFDEFSKPMWGMTEDAKKFFETVQNGEVILEEWQVEMLIEEGYTKEFIASISKNWAQHYQEMKNNISLSAKSANELVSVTDSALKSGEVKVYSNGMNTAQGYANGMYNGKILVQNAASNLALSTVIAFKKELDINSPSKRMFILGEFTMEGFQLGLENVYASIQRSVANLGNELQYAIVSTPQLDYANYITTTTPMMKCATDLYDGEYSIVNVLETNMLLRELLNVTKAGHVIEYKGRELGRTIQNEDRDFYNKTGRGMFEH